MPEITTIENAFADAIRATGLPVPDEIVADDVLRRYKTTGRGPATKNGYYRLADGPVPMGFFGCWRAGIYETWCAKARDEMTVDEFRAHRERIRVMQAERQAEEEAMHAKAREEAQALWNGAQPATPDHPYLRRKAVQPHGLRVHGGNLLLPCYDADGALHSLQYIAGNGAKWHVTGGRVSGCMYVIGEVTGTVVIGEGFATCATVHEVTGLPVVVARNAGNLRHVAQAIRAKHPQARILMAADNDHATPGNPGMAKASEAAKAVGGIVVVPPFPELVEGRTDFNDLAQHHGADMVRQAFTQALERPAQAESARNDTPATPRKASGPTFPPLEDVDTAGSGGTRGVVLVNGADLAPTPIRWLWRNWLALGKLHILAGAPGQGKTTLALTMAATITIGGRWPDGSRCDPGNVLIWSGEDDPADTLLPRLLAAGADRNRCHFIQGTRADDGSVQPFDPARDLSGLRQAIAEICGIRLLIVDPVVSAVTGDSHKNTEVRRALQPLVDMADACNCAVLGITHFAKGGQGTDPTQRVVGSVAFSAVARIVMVAAKVKGEEDGKDARVLARSKSNIGPDDGGFEYHLMQSEPIPGIQASRVAWGKAVEGSARELLTDPDEPPRDGATDAAGMLREELVADGWTSYDLAAAPLRKAGFTKKQIWAASNKLCVLRKKGAMKDGWYWRLPGGDDPQLPDGQHEDSAEGSEDSNFENWESSESSGAVESSTTEVL